MKNYPLVLLHGYPFDHTMWYGVIAAIGSGVRVFVPDLRGFGANHPEEWPDPSLDLMADDIAELLTANNFARAVVAGMSMGGYVALAFAERHRSRLAGLGLISTQAGADTGEVRVARRAMIENVKANGPKVAAEALLPKLFSDANAKNTDFQDFAWNGAEQAGIKGICWALEGMARRPDRTQLLRELELPILIVHGMEDKLIPIDKIRPLAQECARDSFVQVRGAGHATPIEVPDAVAQGLLRLVSSTRPFSALEDAKSNESAR